MMIEKNNIWSRSGFLVLLALLVCLVLHPGPADLLYADDSRAADFSLENILDGKIVSLGQCSSKLLLIEFGSRYCRPCREMVPDLVKLYQNYKASGLMIFKVDIDSDPDREAMKRIAAETKMTFPYLVGTRETAKQYGVILLPTLYLLNREKKVLIKYIGYQPYEVLEHDLKQVK
jgi:thiol-disulfide isomerase/thioredoxin